MKELQLSENYSKDFGIAFRKNNDIVVKVTLSHFNGKFYIHIREYAIDYDTLYTYPTKKGIALLEEGVDGVIEKLIQARDELALMYKPNKQLSLPLEEY